MEKIELKDAFAEFKNQKNIDRPTMMGVLEDVFRTQITKTGRQLRHHRQR